MVPLQLQCRQYKIRCQKIQTGNYVILSNSVLPLHLPRTPMQAHHCYHFYPSQYCSVQTTLSSEVSMTQFALSNPLSSETIIGDRVLIFKQQQQYNNIIKYYYLLIVIQYLLHIVYTAKKMLLHFSINLHNIILLRFPSCICLSNNGNKPTTN